MKKSHEFLLMCLLVLSFLISGCGSTPKTMDEYQKNFNDEIRKIAKERKFSPNDCIIKKLEYNGISYVATVGMTEGTGHAFCEVSMAESPDQLVVAFQVMKGWNPNFFGMIFISAIKAVGQNPNDIATDLGIREKDMYKFGGMYDKSCRKKNIDYELIADEMSYTFIQIINKNQ